MARTKKAATKTIVKTASVSETPAKSVVTASEEKAVKAETPKTDDAKASVETKVAEKTAEVKPVAEKPVEEKAAEMGLAVVVAVSDASGRPIAVHCMDGAYHGSFDVAVNKTYTSTAFQMSTAKLSRLCQPGQDLYGLQFSNNGKVMILGGGEPLMVGKTTIGALGVSGGSAQEDSDLAAYGASALKEVIKCL